MSDDTSSGSRIALDFRDAARTGDVQRLKTVVEAILKQGKIVENVRDGEMATALHLAANDGHTAVCKYLVDDLKMRVDPKDHYGETPLYRAAGQGHLETVEYLLGAGADPAAKPSSGHSMLDNAAKIGNLAMMKLILKNREDVESLCRSPLICAVKHGQLAAVNLLLEHKANPNAKAAEVLPLLAAMDANSSLCFEALLKGGAEIGAIAYPLHVAARCGDTSILKQLMKICDPDVYDDKGLKPIQVAALEDNREFVEIFFPHTARIPYFSDWTIDAMKEQTLSKTAMEKRNMERLTESHGLSDQEIKHMLDKMIKNKEPNFFSDWSPMKRRLFYRTTLSTLPKLRRVTNLRVGEVQSSTIFDTTSKKMHEVQASYLSAICHYRAWHFAGSDGIYEYGNGAKFCVSRRDQAFIFWFRNKDQDVGLVIDGQRLWVEGFIRRTCNGDGTFSYNNHVIQFRDESDTSEEGNESASNKPGSTSTEKHGYIWGSDVELVDYSGSYKESVSNLKLKIQLVRTGIDLIHDYTRDLASFESVCHQAADVLVLFGPEAGKNQWVFEYTMASMDPDRVKPIQIPSSLHWTVVKHEKSSRSGLKAVKKQLGEPTVCDENKDHDNSNTECEESEDFYTIVHKAPFRNLSQCVDAYVIFRREKFFNTKFYMSEMAHAYKSQQKSRGMAKQQAGTSEPDERILEERLSKGTLFCSELHGGLVMYKGDVKWPMPPNPSSKSKWYHCDDLDIK